MPVKLVSETWKRRTKRKDLDHSLLFRRLDKHSRMLHLMECAPCLESALAAVKKLKREIAPYVEEYEAHGTVGGRLYPHHPLKGGDAGADDRVGAGADSSS